jgi:hypothetical protein
MLKVLKSEVILSGGTEILLNIIYKKVTAVILQLLETEAGRAIQTDSIIFSGHALFYNKNGLQRLL